MTGRGRASAAVSEHQESGNDNAGRDHGIGRVAAPTLRAVDTGIKPRADDRRLEFIRGGIGTGERAARTNALQRKILGLEPVDGLSVPHDEDISAHR